MDKFIKHFPEPDIETLFIGGPLDNEKKMMPATQVHVVDDTTYELRSYYEVVREGVRIRKGVMVEESITDERALFLLKAGGHIK